MNFQANRRRRAFQRLLTRSVSVKPIEFARHLLRFMNVAGVLCDFCLL